MYIQTNHCARFLLRQPVEVGRRFTRHIKITRLVYFLFGSVMDYASAENLINAIYKYKSFSRKKVQVWGKQKSQARDALAAFIFNLTSLDIILQLNFYIISHGVSARCWAKLSKDTKKKKNFMQRQLLESRIKFNGEQC